MLKYLYFLIFFNFLSASQVRCDVWLPDIFSEGMVLQAGKPIKIWGNATPRERVAVTLRGRSVVTRANRSGQWEVILPALNAGGPYMLNVLGKNLITIGNVWLGEVFVISGDTITLSSKNTISLESAELTNYSAVFELPKKALPKAKSYDQRSLKWENTAKNAVFSQILQHLNLNAPIGFIINNYPNARLTEWINADSLKNHKIFQDSLKYLEKRYHRRYENNENAGTDIEGYPSVLFNSMIAPLSNYNVAGVLFKYNYIDASHAFYTDYLHQYLVSSFKDAWSDDSLPIVFLNPIVADSVPKSEIAELLLIQKTLYGFENVGVLNLSGSPKSLSAVDLTFALEAIATKDFEVFRSPILLDVENRQGKLLLKFKNAKNLRFDNKYGYGRGFFIAENEREFKPAQAFFLNDSTIELSNDALEKPVAARYNFNDNLAEGNFLIGANFSMPIKTDHWVLTTDTTSYRTTWLAQKSISNSPRLYRKLIIENDSVLVDDENMQPLRSVRNVDEAARILHSILGLKKQRPLNIPVHVKSRKNSEDQITEQLTVQTEEHVFLNADFIYSKSSEKQAILILDKLMPSITDSLLSENFALLIFSPRVLTGLDSVDHVGYLMHADTSGHSYLGQKVNDFFRIVDFIETQHHIIDTAQIHLAQLDSTDNSRFDMMLAFAIDQRIKSLFLQEHLLDVQLDEIDTVREGQYLYAPQLWQYASVEDLIRFSAPRRISIFAPVNSKNRYLSKNEINILTRRGRYAYYRKSVLSHFKIKTGSIYRDTSSLNEGLKKALLEHFFD